MGLLAAAAAFSWTVFMRPDRGLLIAAGTVAHDLCTQTFVSGLDPSSAFDESLASRPGLGPVARKASYDVDRARGTVSVRLAGRVEARAQYRAGAGCLLLHGDAPPGSPPPEPLSSEAPLLPEIAGPGVVDPSDGRLTAALEHAFAETEAPPTRRTKAIVVILNGRVVAEHYAPGYGVATPILGFSLAKSLVNALVGVLVRDHRLNLEGPAPVAAWQGAEDPRRAITVEHLLRMDSGLDLDEDVPGPVNASDRMFYLERDMAAYAEAARLLAQPGTRWAYSSAGTHILARLVRDAAGGTEADVLRFARHELFGPLGMKSVVVETDATGTPIGAHYMLASARDWARFGMLYLDDGVIGGRRILPEGWVAMSARATLDTDYGAGFWTNRSQAEDARGRAEGGMPADSFFASGNLGQRIVVLPSQRVVVVRLGDAIGPDQDIHGLVRLVREVVDAMSGSPAP
jgi:CubicO group peptidase (beta-lactamase class C family)